MTFWKEHPELLALLAIFAAIYFGGFLAELVAPTPAGLTQSIE